MKRSIFSVFCLFSNKKNKALIGPFNRLFSIAVKRWRYSFIRISYIFFSFSSAFAEGSIVDNQQLICLYMLSQLLERELVKCLRLVEAIPMDMSSFYGKSFIKDLPRPRCFSDFCAFRLTEVT